MLFYVFQIDAIHYNARQIIDKKTITYNARSLDKLLDQKLNRIQNIVNILVLRFSSSIHRNLAKHQENYDKNARTTVKNG